jgi:gluconolactonase
LRGPDDLVFDKEGGFWFSDFGKTRARDKDVTGIYYATADGTSIELKIAPLNSPNGIALSPCGKRLYAAMTYERTLLYWDLDGPGQVNPNPKTMFGSHLLSAEFPGRSILDSIAVDSAGNVHVATMLPEGNDPMSNGGITVISADGANSTFYPLALKGLFMPMPSNLCFGGDDMKDVYITTGASGILLKSRVEVAGLPLNFPKAV